MSRGIVFVISGPAGSGKGTVVDLVRKKNPRLGLSVSATTRQPRPGETDGKSYHFITEEEFLEKVNNDEILEYTRYCNNYYGTLKSEVESVIGEGKDIILEIEVEGGLNVKRILGDDVVMIMLVAPSMAEVENRLRGRGTETEESLRGRLERARKELGVAGKYDYIVINETGKIKKCADDVCSIIRSEHLRYRMRQKFIDDFCK